MTRFDEVPVVKSEKKPRIRTFSLDTPGNRGSIADEAYNLVHGKRAEDYGHPRFDFRAISKVWTGLLQDVLKEDAELDEYRVALLMSGLKLARLVKSPGHHDSRVDVIGYMLTMERLDEDDNVVTEEGKLTAEEVADLKRALDQAGRGHTVDLGSFAEYADDLNPLADLVPQPRVSQDDDLDNEPELTPGELRDLEERYGRPSVEEALAFWRKGVERYGIDDDDAPCALVEDLKFAAGDGLVDRFDSYWELHKRGTWYSTAARSSNDLALLAPAAGPLTVVSGAFEGLVIETDGSIWWE